MLGGVFEGWSISRVLRGYDAFAIPASSQQLTNIRHSSSYMSLTGISTSFFNRTEDEARDRRVRIWTSRPVLTKGGSG